jgi:hypothetical protein
MCILSGINPVSILYSEGGGGAIGSVGWSAFTRKEHEKGDNIF